MFADKLGLKQLTDDELLRFRKGLHLALKFLNNVCLKGDNKFIVLKDEVTAADLSCFCEIF